MLGLLYTRLIGHCKPSLCRFVHLALIDLFHSRNRIDFIERFIPPNVENAGEAQSPNA